MMTKELENKIDHCAVLLAHSLMDEEVKIEIIRNIEDVTEKDLDKLIVALEKEQEELAKLGMEVKGFDMQQDGDWARLEQEQKKFASGEVEDFVKKIEAEVLGIMRQQIAA